MMDVTAGLYSLTVDPGLAEDEKTVIHLLAVLTCIGCVLREHCSHGASAVRPAAGDGDLCVGILGAGHQGKQLLLSLLEMTDIKPSHIKVSTRRPKSAEYTDNEAHISRLSSVIVRPTPLAGVKSAGKRFIEQSSSKAMTLQSNYEYASTNNSKKPYGPLPANYICYRCAKPGHHIRQCPMLLDKRVEGPKPVSESKGIPQSFLVKAEPGTKGAMLTSTGEYAIPAIDADAYARGKKERPPFVPHDQSSSEDDADPIPDKLLCPIFVPHDQSSSEDVADPIPDELLFQIFVPHDQSSFKDDTDPIPDELMCQICNHLITDAAVTPCCGNSYCYKCIRKALLDSEQHICFTCKQSGVSPNNLIANKFLRMMVNNFKNEKPNYKLTRKLVQQAVLPPPRLQMSRPLFSRQQNPLRANVNHPPLAIIPTAAPQTKVRPLAPYPPAPVTEQHSLMHSTGQGQPTLPGELDPDPSARRSRESHPEMGPHGYHLSALGHAPPIRPPHPSGPQSRPHHPHRGGDRHWERSFRGPGPQELNPPRIPPGAQPRLPHLGPRFSQPPLSKEHGYRRRHQQDKTTPKLDEFNIDFNEELVKYKDSYSQSRSRSRSPFNGNLLPRSPYSRHNGRSYRRSRSRSHSPPPFQARPWEGAEGPVLFRSRSRSPGGFRSRSPVRRKPPPRGLPPYELQGPSPGGHDRWERERHRQREKEYTDWYNKPSKDYDNQHLTLYHRGRGSRDGERDRISPLPRDYSPQGRGRRARGEIGAPPHNPPSSSSSGTAHQSSTKVLKTKKLLKKRPREEPEPSHYSVDRDDEDSNTVETNKANPEDHINQLSPKRKKSKSSTVRPPLSKTPPLSSRTLITAPSRAPAGKDGEGSVVKSKPRISRKVNISPIVYI